MAHEKIDILIVDDVDDVRQGLAIILEDENYIVSTATNGITALKILENRQPALIITDVLMPAMDGLELINRVNKLYPDIKFILISGGDRATSKVNDLSESERNINNIEITLKKPFDPEQLVEAVKRII